MPAPINLRKDNDLLAMFARVAFLLVVVGLCFASLAPSGWMPRVLYSYHLEHFAAFYLGALSMAAARYRANVFRVMTDIAILATVLEGVRLFIPSHQLYVVEDWVADLGGSLAALSPIIIGDFRKSFRPEQPPPPADDAPVESGIRSPSGGANRVATERLRGES
ncbi:MAG TPA: hypothetical protein VGM25_00025 [Caulobacteraceae bacterium]|jgi:hypothetical protein